MRSSDPPSNIELAKARKIVDVMLEWHWIAIGLRPGPAPDLQSYELRQMLDAAHMIRDYGNTKNADGTTTLCVKADDRLIAALYCITHWQADEPDDVEPIVSGHDKALVCVVMS